MINAKVFLVTRVIKEFHDQVNIATEEAEELELDEQSNLLHSLAVLLFLYQIMKNQEGHDKRKEGREAIK